MEGDVKRWFHKGWRGSSNSFWGDQIWFKCGKFEGIPWPECSVLGWCHTMTPVWKGGWNIKGFINAVNDFCWCAVKYGEWLEFHTGFSGYLVRFFFAEVFCFDMFIQPPVRIPSSNMKSLIVKRHMLQIWKILAGFSRQNRFAEKSNLRFCRKPVLSRPI